MLVLVRAPTPLASLLSLSSLAMVLVRAPKCLKKTAAGFSEIKKFCIKKGMPIDAIESAKVSFDGAKAEIMGAYKAQVREQLAATQQQQLQQQQQQLGGGDDGEDSSQNSTDTLPLPGQRTQHNTDTLPLPGPLPGLLAFMAPVPTASSSSSSVENTTTTVISVERLRCMERSGSSRPISISSHM